MIQPIQQTRDEKISMYMRTRKAKLAEMLANCNEIIEALQSHNIAMVPCSCEKSLGYPGYIRPSESCPIEWHRELARNKQRGR